ncbi:hypothetical protein X730_29630 [Mesorhizobium sp. L103C565B0]|nr:hypothetical protein X730_29630 [Mesorhizobium sp. L103C565B0]
MNPFLIEGRVSTPIKIVVTIAFWEDAMVATPIDIAQAATATTATLLKWQKSMEERATCQNMDQSRRAIQASRELLKRLRQHHRDDMAQSWEDADPSSAASARRPEPM